MKSPDRLLRRILIKRKYFMVLRALLRLTPTKIVSASRPLVFPPTKKFYHEYGVYGGQIQPTYSYDFIFSLDGGASVNIGVLLIQWLGVCLVAAILYFATSKRKNNSIQLK